MELMLLVLVGCAPGTDSASGGDEPKDADGDGSPAAEDCDDADAGVHPGAVEDCDGVDDNCDGSVDEGLMTDWYPDGDGDGWGAGTATRACAGPEGSVANGRDCDDTDASAFPGAAEACDGADDDCDGEVDEGLGDDVTVWPDEDGDGAGDAEASPTTTCAAAAVGVENDYDCDDADAGEPAFVDAAAPGGGDGSLASPFTVIQDGIDAASTCVRVSPGSYYENLDTSGRDIDIASLGSSADTWLRPLDASPLLYVARGEAVQLRGFSLVGGTGLASASSWTDGSGNWYYSYSAAGGAIYLYASSLRMSDVVIEENSVYTDQSYAYCDSSCYNYTYVGYGGGLFAASSTLQLEDVRIAGNSGGSGGGLYLTETELEGTRVEIAGNLASGGPGLYLVGGNADLENLVVNANQDDEGYGGVVCEGCALSLRNCAFVDHQIQLEYLDRAVVDVDSCAFQGGSYGIYALSGTLDIRYSNVFNHPLGDYYGVDDQSAINGNMSVTSSFVEFNNDSDPDNDDLHLSGSSQLVDVGNPDASRNDVDGSRNDVGAFGGPGGSW